MQIETFKTHYSAAELAALAVPTLPTSKVAIRQKAEREGWPFIEVKGIGGARREFAPPATVMNQILSRKADVLLQDAAPSKSTATQIATVGPAPALKDWQKRTAEARAAIIQEVERVAQLVGREKAIMKLVIMAAEGTLPAHLADLVPVANAKSGSSGKRTLSRRTIHRWIHDAGKVSTEQRMDVNALAPKDAHAVAKVPAWATALLAEYQSPQKPSLAQVVEKLAPTLGMDSQRLYHRARRFLDKMGRVELQVGRMGSRAIKDIKPFVRRDSSMLWPGEVYTADGHTFDAEVAHPAHGRPFRPEVTAVVDVATRRMVGWSIDLAESGLAVLDALRRACEVGGIPSVFYVDNGAGYRNALMSTPGVGMEARLGFTMTHSIAYNSQARGVIEKAHQGIWVRAAKNLPTYIGEKMDAQAKNKVHKLTRREIALSGKSKHMLSFRDFIDFCEQQVEAYNSRPHRSLPMVFDEALGRKRHISPNEAWAKGVKEGAQFVIVTPEESRDLFRPQREVKVLRGEVRLFGQIYFSLDLTEYHGEVVRVAYDIHDGSQVWVYDSQERFICTAGFEANKRAYFPESFLEQAGRKRAAGRERRLERKLEEVRLERDGVPLQLVNAAPPMLDVTPADLVDEQTTAAAVVYEEPVQLHTAPAAAARPMFMLESDRYEWLIQNVDAWNSSDMKFLVDFLNDPQGYGQLAQRFELLDMAWTPDLGELLNFRLGQIAGRAAGEN